jgi:hypothetical protein
MSASNDETLKIFMTAPKRREVEILFTREEMQKAFTPVSIARKRRNYEKFSIPVGKRLVGTI